MRQFYKVNYISSACQEPEITKTDAEDDDLKGKVKSLHEAAYKAADKFGELKTGDALYDRILSIFDDRGNKIENYFYADESYFNGKEEYTFDDKGRRVGWIKYNDAGVETDRWVAKYDDDDFLLEQSMTCSDTLVNWRQVFRYDKKGNRVEMIKYNHEGQSVERWRYQYNRYNLLREQTVYNANGSMANIEEYKYDERGNRTEWSKRTMGGASSGKWFAKYDKKNRLVEHNMVDSSGGFFSKESWIYDERGNNIAYCNYLSDDSLDYEFLYRYDNENRIVEKSYIANGATVYSETYKYDLAGNHTEWNWKNAKGRVCAKKTWRYDKYKNLIEEVEYNSAGGIKSKADYKFKYDAQGNWIEKITFSGKTASPKLIFKRTITYHE
jgi:hypothetical protein